jgi:hypothetical protein
MADIKLKDLRYLVAVADTRHFGQAAARCFVSQPTLSAQLKKLEDYLGVQLVERQPRRIALTDAGLAVVSRARRIIEASEEIVAVTQQLRDPLAGRLRLGLLPTIGPYLLPLVVALVACEASGATCADAEQALIATGKGDAAACALAVLAATAGCNATASPSAPASFWPCPPGQHFTEHYQEWGCWPS